MFDFDSLVYDDSKKIPEGVLDIATTVMPVLQYLRKKGMYGVWPHNGEFQIDRERFIATFTDYVITTYPSDNGTLGRRATAEVNGVKFTALLDMED